MTSKPYKELMNLFSLTQFGGHTRLDGKRLFELADLNPADVAEFEYTVSYKLNREAGTIMLYPNKGASHYVQVQCASVDGEIIEVGSVLRVLQGYSRSVINISGPTGTVFKWYRRF